MTIFLDENLDGCQAVIHSLQNAGMSVELHRNHFHPAAPDTEWIPEIAERCWIVLSKDKHIRKNSVELQLVEAVGLQAFFFTSGNLTGDQMGNILQDALKQMQSWVQINSGAAWIVHIHKDGQIKVMWQAPK